MQLVCRQCRIAFALTLEEETGYRKVGMEPIPECFACQQMHKLSFRNGRSLYRRTCDATGKPIISIYRKGAPFAVYERSHWYSDQWDPLQYGRDIDWSKPFFPQFKALQHVVPRPALFNVTPVNSDYCNMCIDNKDSYCVFGGDYNDGVLYGVLCMHNRSCVDCDYSNRNELCHDIFNSFNCYGCRSAVDCKNCGDSAYVSDCIGCRDCILCVNLQNRQFCIGNQELTKEEYKRRKAELLDGNHDTHVRNLERFRSLRANRIVKFVHTISCENCSGDFLENSKNCHRCFFCAECEDVTDGIFASEGRDAFRCSFFGHKSELCYNTMSTVASHHCAHSFFVIHSSECEYCDTMEHAQNCFGCVSLRHRKHCILNKQYSKEEYEKTRERLIEHMRSTGEWGEFFPKDLSCFTYNESTASEFFPLERAEALRRGFRWSDDTEEPVQAEKTISAKELPESIDDIPDDILNWAIQCEQTGRPFRITKQELEFYRAQRIPVPRLHADVRFTDRIAQYCNPPKLFDRLCMKCGKALQSTYAPERTERVHCETCFLKIVH